MTDTEPIIKTHLLAGTSSSKTFLYDLAVGMSPVMQYSTKVASTCICSSNEGNFICVGGSDGSIRIIDGRLRSHHIERTFKAHTGVVSDLIINESNMTILSVGLSGRAINPYDPQSPVTYSPDSMVRIFDIH